METVGWISSQWGLREGGDRVHCWQVTDQVPDRLCSHPHQSSRSLAARMRKGNQKGQSGWNEFMWVSSCIAHYRNYKKIEQKDFTRNWYHRYQGIWVIIIHVCDLKVTFVTFLTMFSKGKIWLLKCWVVGTVGMQAAAKRVPPLYR